MDQPSLVPSETGLQRAVACVDRELRMRLKVYPRWVAQGKLSQAKADEELEGMRLVRRLVVAGRERQFPPCP